MKRLISKALVAMLVSFAPYTTNLYSSTISASWIGPTGTGGDGNWSTATDWSPTGVPNNGSNTYNVTIRR